MQKFRLLNLQTTYRQMGSFLSSVGLIYLILGAVACGRGFSRTDKLGSSTLGTDKGTENIVDAVGKQSEIEIASCSANSLVKGNRIKENLSVVKLKENIKVKYSYEVSRTSVFTKGSQTISGPIDRTYRNVVSSDQFAILLEKAELIAVHNGEETRKNLGKTEITMSGNQLVVEELEPIFILRKCKIADFSL